MNHRTRIRAIPLAGVLLGSILLLAQAPSDEQDFSFTISTAEAWTDTGLDLHSGDVLQISAKSPAGAGICDPAGVNGLARNSDLPLPSAPPGALIAKLFAHGAFPLLIGANRELHIGQDSHLFLGANVTGTPPCQGSFAVQVRKIPEVTNAGGAGAPSDASDQPAKSRNEQLRGQLSTAAEIFLSGQLGGGNKGGNNTGSNAVSSGGSTPPALQLSNAPLDRELLKGIDGLPRRVNDQFANLGDMVNFVIVGSGQQVQAALDAANWHVADTGDKKAVLNAVMDTFDNKDYLQMPMSTLYLFGRAQDFGYEQAEPIAMVASRHHFRMWKAPFTWKGQEVWVGAGTHDIGFAKDKRNGSVTHKIDPAVDGERDNIGSSLQKAGKVKSLTYYLPPDPVQDARNATGDGYHSDGHLLVILLQ